MASRLKINLEISAIIVGNRATMPGTVGPKVVGRKGKVQGNHIVPDKSLFHDYAALTNDSVVRGVGNTAKVVGKGSIKLKFDLGSEKSIIHTLTSVLHIPSAPSCLLSIPRFTDSVDGHAIFRKNKVLLFSDKNILLGTGEMVKGLYHMRVSISSPTDTAAVAHTGPKASWDVWHQQFGHIKILGLKLMHTKRLVTGLDVDPKTATTRNCSS